MAQLNYRKPRDIKQTISVLDIETSSKGELLDIGFYNGESSEYKTFESWLECFEYIYNEHSNLTIYAHNGGGFDFLNLLWSKNFKTIIHLLSDDKIKLIQTGGGILTFKLKLNNDTTLTFIDSFKLLTSSLSQITKNLGVGNKKIEIKKGWYSRMEKYKRFYPADYYEYLKYDVIGLVQALTIFREQINTLFPGFGDLPLTAGALAINSFCMTIPESGIKLPDKKWREIERMSYHGGRTEAVGDGKKETFNFKLSKNSEPIELALFTDVTGIDVNSMYPSEMRTIKFGFDNSNPKHADKNTIHYDDQGLPILGCYKIQFEQVAGCYPILYCEKFIGTGCELTRDNLQPFWVSAHEADYLSKIGDITILEGHYYPMQNIELKKHIENLYKARLAYAAEGNSSAVYIIKIVLNSFYGKFAEKELNTELYYCDIDGFLELSEKHESVTALSSDDDDFIFYETEVLKHPSQIKAFPAVAATTTSLARIKLHKLMESIGAVIYVDTDSVFTQNPIPPHVLDDKELGKSKIEYENVAMDVRGKKNYIIYDQQKLFEQFEIIDGKKVYILYDSDDKIKTDLVIKKRTKGIPNDKILKILPTAADNYRVEYRTPTKSKSLAKNPDAIVSPSMFVKKFRTISRDTTTKDDDFLNDEKLIRNELLDLNNSLFLT